jgi:hypothetical protein
VDHGNELPAIRSNPHCYKDPAASDGQQPILTSSPVGRFAFLFRIAILGLAAIEADIDAEVREAFEGESPSELANARWGIKLALAVGLGLLPSKYRPLFDRLATIRNRLAHGEIHQLTRQHSNMLSDAIDVTFAAIPEEQHEQRRAIMHANEPTLRVGEPNAERFPRGSLNVLHPAKIPRWWSTPFREWLPGHSRLSAALLSTNSKSYRSTQPRMGPCAKPSAWRDGRTTSRQSACRCE